MAGNRTQNVIADQPNHLPLGCCDIEETDRMRFGNAT